MVSKKLTKKLNKCSTLQEFIKKADECYNIACVYLTYGNYHAIFEEEDIDHIGVDFLSKRIKSYSIEYIKGTHAVKLFVVLSV